MRILPLGTELMLIPEPEGTHGHINAVMVVIYSSNIPDIPELDEFASGYGYSSQSIHDSPAWQLGYIPAVVADRLLIKQSLTGSFSLGADGGPKVEFEL